MRCQSSSCCGRIQSDLRKLAGCIVSDMEVERGVGVNTHSMLSARAETSSAGTACKAAYIPASSSQYIRFKQAWQAPTSTSS